MKKAGFSIPFVLLLLLTVKSDIFAETIVKNGESTSNVRVSTNTNGGTVSTYIETTVNGKTQIIESNEEGEIEVENKNGQVTVKKSTPNTTITEVTKSPTPASSESASIEDDVEKEKFIRRFLEIC